MSDAAPAADRQAISLSRGCSANRSWIARIARYSLTANSGTWSSPADQLDKDLMTNLDARVAAHQPVGAELVDLASLAS